jgi:hypothetical protein
MAVTAERWSQYLAGFASTKKIITSNLTVFHHSFIPQVPLEHFHLALHLDGAQLLARSYKVKMNILR